MLPQRYELDVLVARTISHSFTALTSDCSCHSNIKFISSRHRVMSSIYWVRPTWSTQPFRLYQEDKLTKSSGFLSVHSLLEAANFSLVVWSWELSNYYHSMHFFPSFLLAESPSRDLQITGNLQIMVWSCVIPSKCLLLQIKFCSCVTVTTLQCEKW